MLWSRSLRSLRVAALVAPLVGVLVAVAGNVPVSSASAGLTFTAGDLVVTRSVYQNDPTIIAGKTPLPPKCGTIAANTPCSTAVANGDYPYVFNNDAVDTSFGVTTPIYLDEFGRSGALVGSMEVPNSSEPGVTSTSDQIVTSFSSKSELALNLSTDGNDLTFVGYDAPIDAVDASNSNTPGVIDTTNPDMGPFYRVVAELGKNAALHFTRTNAFSGNNGRAAILNAEAGANLLYVAGNAGNGSNPEPTGVVLGAGAQLLQPSTSPEAAQVPAQPTPVGSFNINQLGDTLDKSAKDDNFRGIAVYDNVLYFTKGSGSNGVNTVYFVDTTGRACPSGVGLPEPGAPLPTTSSFTVHNFGTKKPDPGLTPENMCILKGFPINLAATTSNSSFPFGVWFANPDTLYVADEGSGTAKNTTASSTSNGLYTAAAASKTAGLQKWVFKTGGWKLAYTLQSGLNLGVPYSVPGYPTGLNNTDTGTTLPWAPATDGLRNVTGRVNPNGTVSIYTATSTVSGGGDQGADPNEVVEITDDLAATTLPTGEAYQTIDGPTDATVYRGVAFAPGTGAGPTGNLTCAGQTYTDTTIGGNVTVPAGASCTLVDVTVAGNVRVQPDASLVDNGSTVHGNVSATGATGVDVEGGQIDGNLEADGTTGAVSPGSAGAANDLCGASVGGSVVVQKSSAAAPFDIGASPDCASPLAVSGNLQVNANSGALLIGPAVNQQGNVVKGSIVVDANTGGESIEDNTAGGNCQLAGDTPPIVGTGNTASGKNSCNAP